MTQALTMMMYQQKKTLVSACTIKSSLGRVYATRTQEAFCQNYANTGASNGIHAVPIGKAMNNINDNHH